MKSLQEVLQDQTTNLHPWGLILYRKLHINYFIIIK